MTRILCDTPPDHQADAAYLFAQTEDNEASVIQAGKRAIDQSAARNILLLSTEPRGGYRGYTVWKDKLVQLGVPEGVVEFVKLGSDTPHNTLTEALALIQFSKEKGLRSILVTAAPFHQLRAFMTTVRVALRQLPILKIYSLPGMPLSWTKRAVHSQGSLIAPRAELIHTELERIEKYCLKGDLISFDEVLEYLDQRDTFSNFS